MLMSGLCWYRLVDKHSYECGLNKHLKSFWKKSSNRTHTHLPAHSCSTHWLIHTYTNSPFPAYSHYCYAYNTSYLAQAYQLSTNCCKCSERLQRFITTSVTISCQVDNPMSLSTTNPSLAWSSFWFTDVPAYLVLDSERERRDLEKE